MIRAWRTEMNSPGMSVIRFMLEAPALRAPNNRADARVPRGWLCPMTAMAIPLKPYPVVMPDM